MTPLTINIGTSPNSKTGDTVRNAFDKTNKNFTEVYTKLNLLSGGGAATATVDIIGNVSSLSGTVLVDATTGKITTASVPDNVPLIYQFRVLFDGSGNLSSAASLPNGWSSSRSNNQLTITHTTGRTLKTVSYWGYSVAIGYRLRFPSAGYEVNIPASGNTMVFNINAAVTGADLSQHALVTVMF